MVSIEIQSFEVQSKTVRSKRDGKEYTFFHQEAWLHNGSSYPTRCFIPVSSATSGYYPGRYSLADDAYFIDRFGNLSLSRRFSLVSDEG